MYNVEVTRKQLAVIKHLAAGGRGNSRMLLELYSYLWKEDIRLTEDTNPADPDGYRFLAGGVVDIVETPDSIEFHDGSSRTNQGTLDGTAKFVLTHF